MDEAAPIRDFEKLLRESIGLSMETVGASVIRHALKRRMTACAIPDLHAYWAFVTSSPAERQELVDAVIVPETWFFRDREAFSAMVRHVTGNRSGNRPLKLLSLPCSTGEEPYSIAMALLDAGFPDGSFRIDAIDVSSRNLVHAERATYGKNSFRGTDIAFRDRYFEACDGGFRPHGIIRRQVRFHLGNLLAAKPQAGQDNYDVVFCRNLLIYFDRETQGAALTRLRQMLADDGLLLVGPAEAGLPPLHGFASVRFPRAFAFAKIETSPMKCVEPPVARKPGPVPAKAARAPQRQTASKRPAPRPFAQKPVPQKPQTDSPDRAAASLAAIESAADAGRLTEVNAAVERHLAEFGPSPDAFYWLGLAHDAADAMEDAMRNYRKALYLAPDHQRALAQLRLLQQRRGDHSGAKALADRLDRLAKRSDI
ncbi:MAG: methyltransferase [Bosea sp.]|uniref:CheR family methyltransferase n=1 Tax=Bosea sp. (in: a-proteobacteria) TaxID=1871050 RepID=UPI001AD14244|nr:CheR family methyltransferase [Bosea sp. (in: a-proteobacteria)]MBN9454224.1 methyltransferase [Bosea sp. (in: a-proteobacteria)]